MLRQLATFVAIGLAVSLPFLIYVGINGGAVHYFVQGVRFSAADGGSTSNVTVENNLTLGGTAVDNVATGMTLSNNVNNTDPLLVNASALDFHLRAASPAIGAGISLSYVTNDFDGVSRPQGAPYAIGAYQFK